MKKGERATKRIFIFMLIFIMFMPVHTVQATADTSESACLINTVTGEILFEKNATEKRPMASTTKIMTLLVALENSKMDEIVTVPREATLEEGSSAYLKAGAEITMYDLLHGLMLNSGNDAAVAVSCHISGSVEEFAKLMTETAQRLGAMDTQFVNPNGLEAEGHYTTARDLAVITQYALSVDGFREIVSARSYTGTMTMPDGTTERVEYINHNRLLKEVEGCIGVKTGFTKAAGRCLVSAVDNGGAQYIAVTLNDPDDWNTHKELYEYAYNNHTLKTVINAGDCIKHMISEKSRCDLVAKDGYSVYVNEKNPHNFEMVVHLPESLEIPLNEGEKVGVLEIKLNDRTLKKIDITANCTFIPNKETKVKNCYMFTVLTLIRNLL